MDEDDGRPKADWRGRPKLVSEGYWIAVGFNNASGMGCILSCFWYFVAAGWDGWSSGFSCCVGWFLVAMWAGILGLYRMCLPCRWFFFLIYQPNNRKYILTSSFRYRKYVWSFGKGQRWWNIGAWSRRYEKGHLHNLNVNPSAGCRCRCGGRW